MERRGFLAGLCACAGATPGCLAPNASGEPDSPGASDGSSTSAGRQSPADAPTEEAEVRGVCRKNVQPDVGIRAIDDPATAPDWASAGLDGPAADGLDPDSTVVGLTADGRARAYPVRVLFRHEVVNDVFAGPVLVTYCPLCNSGMVARRTVDGRPTIFAVSGILWSPREGSAELEAADERVFGVTRLDADAEVVRSRNLVMYDRRTGSYWSQLLARAICGPEAGTDLAVLPAETTTWGAWRAAHPETDVLLPAPRSGTV